jgi:N-acetyl-alpha-D-muramate 1-phosphate uridylyltransferase
MLEVSGKPFAHWQLRWLANQGVTSVIYLLGHKGEQVANFVGDGSQWNLEIHCEFDGDRLLGTGGALRNAMRNTSVQDTFFVLYGDSYLSAPLRKILRYFESDPREALMCVYKNNDHWERSNVVFDGSTVTNYEKFSADRPSDMTYIDYGLSLFTKSLITNLMVENKVADLSVLMSELSREGKLAGYRVDERYYEIGTVAGLEELKRYLDVGER